MKIFNNLFIIAILLMSTLGCSESGRDSSVNPNTTNYLVTTVQYKNIDAVDPNLLSLDVYNYAASPALKPVVIYVHGGGWRMGDKTNQLENKLTLFNSLDYIFVSINYRLSPNPSELDNPNRIKYPDHNKDVADAVKWLYDNISQYGGNPQKMALLGHSAGAHLVSLTGTSQEFLPALGIPLNAIKGVASIDTEGYDVPSQISDELYQNAFGTDMNLNVEASPLYNITIGNSYPMFFVAKRGTEDRINLADNFIEKLQMAGVDVSEVDGSIYDHDGINDAIGNPTDNVITPALTLFFKQCFQ